MTRAEIFSIWPRPWHVNEKRGYIVEDSFDCEVVTVDAWDTRSADGAKALAALIVEWSQEDEPQPDTFSGAPP